MDKGAQKSHVHLIVRGRVQGVFFRASTRDVARRLGLKGWVRNRYDGSVEIEAEGDKDAVGRFVSWCHDGPPGALVREVERDDLPFSGRFKDFSIRYWD